MRAGILTDWPGKSDAHGSRHPALWHMLDVAAVALELWPHGPLRDQPEPVRNALLFLIALHDLGKVSRTFRQQIEARRVPPDNGRHWQLTYRHLRDQDALLAQLCGGSQAVRKALYGAVAGHHGDPVGVLEAQALRRQGACIGADAQAAAIWVIETLAAHFAPLSLDGLTEDAALRLSWLLSGLTVEADWIGSNTAWFPFSPSIDDLADYWSIARKQAASAVQQAGLSLARPAILHAEELAGGVLRPMQQMVADIALPQGPMLALIEDATGAGKTEAALILASRMMQAGKGRGIYFALPSMASSEAMFIRMRAQMSRLFEGRPSLALAHGRRGLSDAFAEVRGNWNRSGEEIFAEDACAPWLADDRRLSLLAEIGVGTIDQALMSILPTRFHTLRQAALAGQVLIVDEAHDYDPYMERELRALLEFHGAFGGSAILMTATLPQSMRAGYVAAWQEGRRRAGAPCAMDVTLPSAYPALTLLGQTGEARAVDPVPQTCRRIEIVRLGQIEAAVQLLAEGVQAGAACVWVRNAVDDAHAAVEALHSAGIPAQLLHARFAMTDRQRIEQQMMARFGTNGQGRAGPVLVATQVVQASLDLDFDLMVSDLAPMGDLIQRAGRLWRHADRSRPVPGPRLHLLTPDPDMVTSARWVFDLQPSGGWIYPSDVLWRTARALLREAAILAPENLRALIAEVYEGHLPVPEVLERAELEHIGKEQAQVSQARFNVLNVAEGYGQSSQSFDDRRFPTRLGEEQVVLVLMRHVDGQLGFWAQADTDFRAAALSEVQMSRRLYERTGLEAAQTQPDIARLRASWQDWEREVRKIAVVEEDGTIVEGLRYEADRGLVMASA
ncbi:CRISPR-associated helicase Cas3' [Xanthobacter sp. TB0136]|uniref:CRISPR-associated helicase Cas3' n=1 Tax=Xanthobacter sp. TB0136 TaxID=3459177 RepID=UPI0040394137